MTVPTLPPDIWFRISKLLSPPELSSISQVNQTLNKIATDETHFRRVLAIPQQPRTKPSTVYRRLRAFTKPPSSTVQRLSPGTDILCIVENTLLLIDATTGRLITFPTANAANLNDLVDRKCWKKGRVLPNEVRKRFAVLPGARIAFLKGSNPIHLTILDVTTWDMEKHVIPGERGNVALLRGSHVFTAGNNGEWIIYPIDKETAALVDWRQGAIIRTVKTIRRALTSKWLWGTCTATKVRTIVGVVHQESDRSKNLIRATGFDGSEVVFEYERDRGLYSVMRSSDTSTHLVLTRQGNSFGNLQFWAHRELSGSEQTWSGELVTLIYTKLILNGNVIEAIPQGYWGKTNYATSNYSQHFVVLENDGVMQSVCSPRPLQGSQVVWCKRTSDSGLAVIGGGGSTSVNVVKLKRLPGSAKLYHWIFEDYDPEEAPMHTWSVDGLDNLCVLADHIIVAITVDGRVESFHFDGFCRDKGAYACPWVRTLQNFRWPEGSCVAEPDSPPRKRRRTARRASQAPGNETT